MPLSPVANQTNYDDHRRFGAAGGISGYVLAKAGVKVLMLEAGRNYDPVKETPMFHSPRQAPLRGAPTRQALRVYDATIDGGWQVPGELHTRARLGFSLVASAHARRPNKPLGPHIAANGSA
jgi:choline dehydrogenase-like flavoprotein